MKTSATVSGPDAGRGFREPAKFYRKQIIDASRDAKFFAEGVSSLGRAASWAFLQAAGMRRRSVATASAGD
jgi:hypothetical protein